MFLENLGAQLKASKITAVDFFDDLSSPYARKRFFWAFIGFGLAFCVIEYFSRTLLPSGTLRDVIDATAVQLISSTIIILGFYFAYMHFIGPNEGLREISVTRPRDIRERMEKLPISSRFYTFWGRSGSYFRSGPLLALDQQSRAQKFVTDIEVMLPDPNDDRLIKSYQEILSSLGERSDGNPLLAHVLATSIACAVVAANNKYIRIRLFYSKFLPAFRVDMSENGAIVTQDDPAKSALFFEFGSEFFEMFRTTVRNEMSVSREVNWDKALFEGRRLDAACCDTKTLSAFGIEVANVDMLQQDVARLITERKHRYK